jgi:hypothetical protein
VKVILVASLFSLAALSSGASQAPALPPVRNVAIRIAQSPDSFGGGAGPVVLSTGQVVVAHRATKRVLMYDPTLAEAITIIDPASPPPNRFPAYPPKLFRGAGDTVYMTDIKSGYLRVIAPTGAIVRWQPFADPEDLGWITNLYAGAQFGENGNVYFAATLVRREPGNFSAEPHDTLYLVHYNLRSQRRDTLGFINVKRSSTPVESGGPSGQGRSVTMYIAPFDIGDAIALNSLGELAVIRADDFHVDWLLPNGAWRHAPPVGWQWKRYTDEEKRVIAAERNASFDAGKVQVAQRADAPARSITMASAPIPDIEPAFAPMSAIADHNGLIWIRLGASSMNRVAGQPTYAAIDGSGAIVDRIQLPYDRTLIGFDKAGHIYAATGGGRIELYRPR